MVIFFYQAKTEPVSTSPEAVTIDRYAPTYPQPKRPLLSAAFAATMFVAPVSTAPENVSVDRSTPVYAQPDRTVKRAAGTTWVGPILTASESTSFDRWAPTWTQPSRKTTYADSSGSFAQVFVSTAATVTPLDWIQQHPRPSRAAIQFNRSFAVSVLTTAGETITPDKWGPTWVQPKRDARYAAGSFVYPPREHVTSDKWAPFWRQPDRVSRYATGTTTVSVAGLSALPVSMGFLPTCVQPSRTPRPLDGSFVVLVSAIAAPDPGHSPYLFFVAIEDSGGDWADTKIEIA